MSSSAILKFEPRVERFASTIFVRSSGVITDSVLSVSSVNDSFGISEEHLVPHQMKDPV